MKWLVLLMLLICGCEEEITDFNPKYNIQGIWLEDNYPHNSISIEDSCIVQQGFPLVKGFNIKYVFSDIYYCKFINILGKTDSFTLKILDINNTKLTVQLYNYYFHQNITFYK